MDQREIADIQHHEGIFMVGLPNTTLLVVQALRRKTGKSMANIIGLALQSLAEKVLTQEDLQRLAEEIKKSGIYNQ